jgi:bifunctional DNase/RNase
MEEKIHKAIFSKVIQSSNYSAFILEADKKQFAIYTAPTSGLHIEDMLSKAEKRPQTHEFIDTIFSGFGITINKVLLCEVKDNIYYSKIFLTKKDKDFEEILEIDVRPSDALLLALKHQADVYCNQRVLDQSPEYIE